MWNIPHAEKTLHKIAEFFFLLLWHSSEVKGPTLHTKKGEQHGGKFCMIWVSNRHKEPATEVITVMHHVLERRASGSTGCVSRHIQLAASQKKLSAPLPWHRTRVLYCTVSPERVADRARRETRRYATFPTWGGASAPLPFLHIDFLFEPTFHKAPFQTYKWLWGFPWRQSQATKTDCKWMMKLLYCTVLYGIKVINSRQRYILHLERKYSKVHYRYKHSYWNIHIPKIPRLL